MGNQLALNCFESLAKPAPQSVYVRQDGGGGSNLFLLSRQELFREGKGVVVRLQVRRKYADQSLYIPS